MRMTATQATIVFACPNCGAIYHATQRRGVDTHFGIFSCLACHAQVYAWHGLMISWTGSSDYQQLAKSRRPHLPRQRGDRIGSCLLDCMTPVLALFRASRDVRLKSGMRIEADVGLSDWHFLRK